MLRYVDKHLRPLDAEHYSAAGFLPYRKSSDGRVEVLLARPKLSTGERMGLHPLGMSGMFHLGRIMDIQERCGSIVSFDWRGNYIYKVL